MTTAPLTRSAAAKASLAAKVGLVVLAAGGIALAIYTLPDIETPNHAKPDLAGPAQNTPGTTVTPVNFTTMGRSLTLAAEFPPAPVDPGIDPDSGDDPTPPSPTGPAGREIRFLGAISEPNRYVALLRIDGQQKFLAPGSVFNGVRVVEVTASQVSIEIEEGGAFGDRQTIQMAERNRPAFTAAAPAPVPDPNAAAMEAGEAAAPMPSFPGMPPGMSPEMMRNLSPQQIEAMRRQFQTQQAQPAGGGDGSQ